MASARDRSNFILGAVLLRLAVGRVLGISPRSVAVERYCDHCAAAHGRPNIVGGALEVSVSHSVDAVVVAVSMAGPVGVDVERIPDAVRPAALRKSLTDAELQRTPVVGPNEFATYWTRKESVLKATGDGLRQDLSSIQVSDPHRPPELERYPRRPDVVLAARMRSLQPPAGYAATLTVLGGLERVTEYDATPLLLSAPREPLRTRVSGSPPASR